VKGMTLASPHLVAGGAGASRTARDGTTLGVVPRGLAGASRRVQPSRPRRDYTCQSGRGQADCRHLGASRPAGRRPEAPAAGRRALRPARAA